MPIVRIEYKKEIFSQEKMQTIATALQAFSAQVTGYDKADISVFATENQITVNAASIEVYIYANFPNATEEAMEKMLEDLKVLVTDFKQEQRIEVPFNLSVVKMNWKFQLEV
jgi:hypothetical protein